MVHFNIVELKELSGKEAHIYSVIMDGEEDSLLEQFFDENQHIEEESLNDLYSKIRTMANYTGCRKEFFKDGEGALGDGVVALRSGHLRLYAIYFCNTTILFGSGGYKDEGIRAYQEDPALNAKAQQVRKIAAIINKAILERDIVIESDGTINDVNFDCYE